MNTNLPPHERNKKQRMIICGVVPGPKMPGDIDSFLHPLFDELKQLETGIEVTDPTRTRFTLRGGLTWVIADGMAQAKLLRWVGPNAYKLCRFCGIWGTYASHVYCPHTTAVEKTGDDVADPEDPDATQPDIFDPSYRDYDRSSEFELDQQVQSLAGTQPTTVMERRTQFDSDAASLSDAGAEALASHFPPKNWDLAALPVYTDDLVRQIMVKTEGNKRLGKVLGMFHSEDMWQHH